jgi:hypothetical protein
MPSTLTRTARATQLPEAPPRRAPRAAESARDRRPGSRARPRSAARRREPEEPLDRRDLERAASNAPPNARREEPPSRPAILPTAPPNTVSATASARSQFLIQNDGSRASRTPTSIAAARPGPAARPSAFQSILADRLAMIRRPSCRRCPQPPTPVAIPSPIAAPTLDQSVACEPRRARPDPLRPRPHRVPVDRSDRGSSPAASPACPAECSRPPPRHP